MCDSARLLYLLTYLLTYLLRRVSPDHLITYLLTNSAKCY